VLFIITLIDIYEGVKTTIESALIGTDFSTVPIVAEDNEGIIRPSIKINMDDNKSDKLNYKHKERTLTVRVYFFAKDKVKYKIDNLKMQDILENAFLNDVKITDSFYMPIINDGITTNVVNSVLDFSFELYSIEEIDELILDSTGYEMMEELDFTLESEE